MALTKEFMEAVSQENLLRVKIMLKDSLLVDTSFRQFGEMVKYAERQGCDIWISDDEDDAVFSQSSEELNAILAGLVNNFSKRRVNHLKKMINKLYASKHKTDQKYRREEVIVIKKTQKVLEEYRGIRENRMKIKDICAKIRKKGTLYTKDIDAIRDAATRIVNHCDKITGR